MANQPMTKPEPARPGGAKQAGEPRSSWEESGEIRHAGYRYRYRCIRSPQRDYEPVLFLGGAFQTMRSLYKFAEVFTAHSSAILVDLPGSGDTDLPPAEVGLDFFAECIRKLLDCLGIERVNLVGVSFGTAIAYTVAQRFPERIANLALIGTMSHADERIEDALERSNEALATGDMALFADRVSSVLLNHERKNTISNFARGERLLRVAVGRMTDREMEQFEVNGRRILLHRRLDTSRPVLARTLVFTGEHDSVTTPAHCLDVAASIRDAYWALVRDADHLVPLERFDVCVRLVDGFLRGEEPVAGTDCSVVWKVKTPNRLAA